MRIERKIIGTTAVTILVALAVTGLVAIPSLLRIDNLTAELEGHMNNIERSYLMRSYIKSSLSDIEKVQSKIGVVQDTYIVEGEELAFIQALEQAAETANVEQELSLQTVNELEITPWDREIPVGIKVDGPFSNVMSWLNEVEHLDYFIPFDSIALDVRRVSGGADLGGNLTGRFSGRVYWVAEDAPYFIGFHELVESGQLESADEEEGEDD